MKEKENSPEGDLQHFLYLAAAQVRYRLVRMEARESYSAEMARLRLLEELIKEQIPHENFDSSARATR